MGLVGFHRLRMKKSMEGGRKAVFSLAQTVGSIFTSMLMFLAWNFVKYFCVLALEIL